MHSVLRHILKHDNGTQVILKNSWKCSSKFRCYSTSNNEYDIVISGGGMVGFAAACAIGQSSRLTNQKVLLLESQKHKHWALPDEYNNRVCAINPRTESLFKKLGVWDSITEMRAQPIKKMQVWEGCSDAMITFGEENLDEVVAHIVENDVTLHALKQNLPKHVEVAYETKIKEYNLPKDIDSLVNIILEDGSEIQTKMLVGADGANSLVRKTMGVEYMTSEYDQMAIVATLELSEEEVNTTAWQKFITTGPIAILPLSSTRSSLVWSTTKKEAKKLIKLPDDEFADALNSALWGDSGGNELIQNIQDQWRRILQYTGGTSMKQLPPSISRIIEGSRGMFPLGLGHAIHYTAPRVALIGDAAHRVHPLAGQGVNLGFGDVAELVETLENTVSTGTKIGDPQFLHKYESKRQLHNFMTLSSIDALHKIYSTEFPPIVLVRSLGLTGIDACSWAKKRIMHHAGG